VAERQRTAAPSLSRTIGILLRTAHLGAMAVLVGGAWYGLPADALGAPLWATAVTGLGLLASEASHSRHWVYQGRGVMVLAHLGALGLARALGPSGLMVALVIGAVGSHLPKSLRSWSFRHRTWVD
jgi:predicted LPLAT superfamily acyltransferase